MACFFSSTKRISHCFSIHFSSLNQSDSNLMGFGSILSREKKQNPSNPVASSSPMRTQLEELELVFKKFDINGDGKISSSELGSVLGSLGLQPSEDELLKIIKEIDTDGDGFIDFKEFVELNTKGVDSNKVLENLKDAFLVYDIDGNGFITAEELHQVFKSLGDECSIMECRKMISGVDKDGNGMIDFEEFKVMMMAGARS